MTNKLRDYIRIVEGRLDEITLAPVRPARVAEPPPPPPREPYDRGRGDEPKGGDFWFRNGTKNPITGTANEIVNLSGQVMLLDPEKFGITADEVMEYLKARDSSGAAAKEYESYLSGTEYDLSHVALFWQSSKLAFRMLIEQGWVRIAYRPPSGISFAGSPPALKRQITQAAEIFPLMQLDTILVIEVTNYDVGNGRYLNNGKNRILRFNKKDFAGFAGAFGALRQWHENDVVPAHNYLFIVSPAPPEWMAERQITSTQKTIPITTKTGIARWKRWVIMTLAEEPTGLPPDHYLYRVPRSIAKIGTTRLEPQSKGRIAIWGDRWFTIDKTDIEVKRNGRWEPLD